MELLSTALLFATIAAAFIFIGARFWARPKSAIERVTMATAVAAAVRGPQRPGAAFRDLVKRLGSVLPTSPRNVTVMERRMIRAGFRAPGAVKTFYGAKLVLAVLVPVLAMLVAAQAGVSKDNLGMVFVGGLAVGFMGPNEFIRMRAKRRQKQIRRGLPNALDLLVVCVESGLGLDQAIMQTAKELQKAHPEICQEFAQVNYELRAGERRAQALRNLAGRNSVDELKKLVAVLIQADRFGTGIAQTLRLHSDYMRVQVRQAAEEKAAKLGVKLVFPIFFCILPALFVVTVGPVMVRIVRELLPMMQNM
jgi:tight adherence protein C